MADTVSVRNSDTSFDSSESSPFLDGVDFFSEEGHPNAFLEFDPTLWKNLQNAFKKEFGKSSFDTWFKHLEYGSFQKGRLVLSLPTPFMRDWISTHYGSRLKLLVRQIISSLKEVDLIVSHQEKISEHEFSKDSKETNLALEAPFIQKSEDTFQLSSIGADLDPRFTFENFVVGKTNELAYAAALRVAEEKGVTFNPLFLYGGVGLGKTHLMHAIAWKIRATHPERRFIYVSAEKFMYQFIRALRHKDTMAFKEQFRSVDVLMMDDVQFICGEFSQCKGHFRKNFPC